MKAYEITDKFIEAIKSDKYDFLRINFPNGDMVGHTGNYEATVIAMKAVDECIGKIMKAVDDSNSTLVVVADHGNCEEMIDDKGQAKTSHTINPVPFIIYGKEASNIEIKQGDFGLANLASSICTLLGVNPNEHWMESIIERKEQ